MKQRTFTLSFLFIFIFLLLTPKVNAQAFCCCTNTGCQANPAPGVFMDCNAVCNLFGGDTNGGDINGYTSAALCTAACTTPVELTSFTISVNGVDINLNWETASEFENKGFEILRASGIELDWELIGFIEGNGTTHEFMKYEFTDKNAPIGTNYYRLKQIDENGDFAYSDIKVARLNEDVAVNIWPTLAKNDLFISANENFRDKLVQIELFDLVGHRHLATEFTGQFRLDISDLPKGHFIINLKIDQRFETLRFVKIE